MCSNGTENNSQETLEMEPYRQKKQGRLKLTRRKAFEEDLKKMELTWGTTEREANERNSWRKRSRCIILRSLSNNKT